MFNQVKLKYNKIKAVQACLTFMSRIQCISKFIRSTFMASNEAVRTEMKARTILGRYYCQHLAVSCSYKLKAKLRQTQLPKAEANDKLRHTQFA